MFAQLLPQIDPTPSKVNAIYWEAAEVIHRLVPLLGESPLPPGEYAQPLSPSPLSLGKYDALGVHVALGAKAATRPRAEHAIQCARIGAEYLRCAISAHTEEYPQSSRLVAILTAAKYAGITQEELNRQTWVWRFFACGRRMPLNETVLYAFQAAWEIGQYDFARSIALRGYGELTQEQAAKLNES
jgi:hypothetical protein